MTDKTSTTQMYRVVINASAQAIWDAITSPDWSERWGYGGRVAYDMKPGGRFCHHAADDMKAVGLPDELILGEVIEADAPRKLVQTWHPQWSEESKAERPSRLTYEITEHQSGVSTLTIYHEVDGAPSVGAMISGGGDPAQGAGGWPWALSDLKTLLETGKRMAA